jgi:RHS repeat-associated protein
MFRHCRAALAALLCAVSFSAIALPPTVSISNPVSGLTFTAPASITLNATAADPDGTIANVKFYRGTTLLGTDTTAPYSFSWTNVAAGTYSVTATATDNLGAVTTSSAVSVTVAANVVPTVSITSPTAGTTFTAASAILLTANAADINNGTITKVDFFRGTTLLGTDTTSPYSYSWTNPVAGNYSITAKATDNSGATKTSTAVAISVVANVAPTVSITSPAAGASFTAPASITINANASDVNSGTVTKVDFFIGTTLLGTDTSAPYSYAWTNAAAGSYSITAQATDNSGAVKTSAAVAITVTAANTPPTVSITSPLGGANFTAPAAITINANAADTTGTVTQVDFYNGTTLLGTDTTVPYSFAWTNVAAGSYSITAKAIDNSGAITTSGAVAIGVAAPNTPPTVSISSPAAGSAFTAPAAITINATASDANGTVTKVDFYNGTTLLGSDATSPYSFAWANVAAGSYSITAKATDNNGAVTTSAATTITVAVANTPPTISITSPAAGASFAAPAAININANAADANGTVTQVDFYNGTTLLGSDTTAPYSFAWTNVAAGSYSITAKVTDNAGAVTTTSAIALSVYAVNPGLTVSLTSPPNGSSYTAPSSITLNAAANNLNGTLSRFDFYSGTTLLCPVVLTTPFSSATASCNWSGVPVGSYNITVKVTDNLGAVSTTGVTSITVQATNVAPLVSLTSPSAGASFSAPATITLSATASDNNGTVSKVDFYNGTTLLGTDTTSPYSFVWSNVSTGTYSITARATDNAGAVTTTTPASITVSAINVPPAVSLAGTLNGAVFTAPAAVTLNAIATDSDGSISKVEFYEGANLIGSDTTSPFSFVWSSVGVGSYDITAKATDNSGAVVASAVSSINVLPANTGLLINFTSPENAERYTAPATIPLNIATSNSNGVISKVEFYSGTNLLCNVDMGSIYSIAWANCTLNGIPVGSYNISAKTYDQLGVSTTTPVINLVVQSTNVPPKVKLTSPISTDIFVVPADITLNADAADNNGTVTKVDFYNGTNLLGTSTTAPYSFAWNGVGIGNYNITAKATDNVGATTTTATTVVNVLPVNILPTVALTSPVPGAIFNEIVDANSYIFGPNINLSATAADADGAITKVDFYVNSPPICQDCAEARTATGATIAKSPIAARSATTTNSSINAAVSTADVLANWTLVGTATNPPYNSVFNNARQGNVSLAALATDSRGGVTTSEVVSIFVNSPPTVALVTPISDTIFTTPANILFSANADDFDNGINKVEFFNGSTLLGASTTVPYSFAWSGVGLGSYTITAKATDNVGATTTTNPVTISVLPINVLPTVSLTSPANGAIVTAPASLVLNAVAADSDGSVSKVEFFTGSDLVGTATTAPYSTTWNTLYTGTYTLSARVTDNRGDSTLSAPVNITVNGAPYVTITSPSNGSRISATDGAITLTAEASDYDGSVTKVDFYNGATLLGTATTAPYSISLPSLAVGNYNLTALATDNLGAITISSIVSISIYSPPTISITSPANGARFVAVPATINFTVNANDADGAITKVEYFNGSELIGTATSAPFSFTWSNVPNGGYLIRAKATDNLGDTTNSALVKVNVGDGETITYLHNDLAGSPLAATDTTGNIVWKEYYRPYGERLNIQAESTSNRQWFHGKAADADTGLQYFGARYYDPVLGRFMGVDPVGFQEDNIHSFNKYAYGNNNPYRFIDPDGKQAVGVDVLNSYVGQQWAQTQQVVVDGYIQSMNTAAQAYGAVALAVVGPEAILGRVLGRIGSEFINPATVRFSQDSISATFKDGSKVNELAQALRSGATKADQIPAIRLVERDGKLYSLDNRRLEAFRRAERDVPYTMAKPEEVARRNFTTRNDGESVRVRGE